MTITYEHVTEVKVYLDKQIVGKIRQVSKTDGWRYEPTRGMPGRCFDTIEEVKRSLEEE